MVFSEPNSTIKSSITHINSWNYTHQQVEKRNSNRNYGFLFVLSQFVRLLMRLSLFTFFCDFYFCFIARHFLFFSQFLSLR